MNHFKLFFKLVKSKWHSFLIYIGIFLVTFALMIQFNQPASEMYQAYSSDIAIIDHDNSEQSELLKDYLAKENTLIDYDSKEAIEDALFLRMLDFGLVIEEGFLEDASKISLIYDPGIASAGARGEAMIEEYLQLTNSYRQMYPELPNAQLHEKVLDALNTENQVEMLSDAQTLSELSMTNSYFNILGYALMGLMINVIGECIVLMFGRLAYLRQQCSPSKPRQVILSVFGGSLALGVLIVTGMCLIIIAFQRNLLSTENGWLYFVNALCFGFSIIAISCLIGMIASGHSDIDTDKSQITMYSNIVSLTCAFISGLFVPQYLIHPIILKFASLTPAYWYAKANDLLAQKEITSFAQAGEIFQAQGITLLFGIVFLVLAYLLYRAKRQRQAI